MNSDEEGQVMNSGVGIDANPGSGANTDGVNKADADAIERAPDAALQFVEEYRRAAQDVWYQAERMRFAGEALLAELDRLATDAKSAA